MRLTFHGVCLRSCFPHYGINNFKKLLAEGYHYVDSTQYMELMKSMDSGHHSFLRPRCFGKSLAVSVIEVYVQRVRSGVVVR